MKSMKKLASLLLALAMIFALATTAFAQTDGTAAAGKGSITIYNASKDVTYKIVKIFSANVTGTDDGPITYTGDIPDALKAVFTTDTIGYIKVVDGKSNTEVTEAVTNWAKDQEPDRSLKSDGTALTFAGLDYGYYAVVSSQGALVTIDSTNPNVNITDKNTSPTLDKKITGANSIDENGKKALAQIGTVVEYEVTITVGKGAKNYVFHDKMGDGLTFNNDVTVEGVNADKYTITTNPDTGDTFTIAFDDGIGDQTEITITYTATINESALTNDPEKNTAYLSYGDGHQTVVNETEVYNAQFTVTKKDGNDKPLAGAGFVIMKDNKYYKYTAGTDSTSAKVEWVDDIANATEYISDASGNVTPFIGLANGTYTLVEKTVPAGYNKAADSSFTIAEHNYTADNLEQRTTVINNAGTQLPSTGGMGTTLFYIVGGVLVAAAVVLLVTKKRMASN